MIFFKVSCAVVFAEAAFVNASLGLIIFNAEKNVCIPDASFLFVTAGGGGFWAESYSGIVVSRIIRRTAVFIFTSLVNAENSAGVFDSRAVDIAGIKLFIEGG